MPTSASSDLEEGKAVDLHKTIKTTWKGKIWDTFDLPPNERKLLAKVDMFLLTFASLGYFIKNLDQSNVSNAFLSGMEEDLAMYGNQLVTTSIWTVGYVIGQIPSNLLLTRVSPRWVIPSLELGWGICTLATYRVNSYHSLYALRFFVGLFESGFYPGIHYLIGGWYTPREIGKRAMIFWLAGSIGTMFSGFLQAAAYTNLSGVGGLAGWRWLFIIDAIITIPIALFGYIFLPGIPLQDKKEWWLTEEQNQLAISRLNQVGRAGRSPWSKAKIRKLFSTWHIYILPFLYVIWNNGYPQNPMGYYLKSFNKTPAPVPGRSYTVSQINNRELIRYTVEADISATPCYGYLHCGFAGLCLVVRRVLCVVAVGPSFTSVPVSALAIAIPLRIIPLYNNIRGHFALYYLVSIGQGAGPLILSWINEICSQDTEKRALLVAMGNDFAYVVQAVGPNFYWKTTDFPAARKGFTAVIIFQILLVIWTTLILYLLKRDKRKAGDADSFVSDEDVDVVTTLETPTSVDKNFDDLHKA